MINAAILDINLHGEMVWPVADALADRSVPFVLATGYAPAMFPPRHAGAAYSRKPIEPGRVAEVLSGT